MLWLEARDRVPTRLRHVLPAAMLEAF